MYDGLVTTLFKDRLYLSSENHIVFAARGKSDRNVALSNAIQLAKAEFEGRWKKGIDVPTTVSSSVPSETPCLQIIDYYLWAIQRMIERAEDRYFRYLADHYKLIIDRDDERTARWGAYYTSKNPFALDKMMPVL